MHPRTILRAHPHAVVQQVDMTVIMGVSLWQSLYSCSLDHCALWSRAGPKGAAPSLPAACDRTPMASPQCPSWGTGASTSRRDRGGWRTGSSNENFDKKRSYDLGSTGFCCAIKALFLSLSCFRCRFLTCKEKDIMFGGGGVPPRALPPCPRWRANCGQFSPLMTLEKKKGCWPPPHTSSRSAHSADRFDGPHYIF